MEDGLDALWRAVVQRDAEGVAEGLEVGFGCALWLLSVIEHGEFAA